MGRLTDDILALFGVKPSDRISAVKNPTDIEIPLMFPTREQILSGNTETAVEEKTTNKDDCFSCKVVGCSVLSGAAGAILYAVKTNTPNFSGRKLRLYRVQGASVASVLVLLACSRWFDAGIFDKDKADMSILDQTKDDLRRLLVFCHIDPPSMLSAPAQTEQKDNKNT